MRRFYIHNFRCLENFELPLKGLASVLLIGKNGSGKSTIGAALEVLQKIARGTNRVGELLKPQDLTRGRTDVPVRFEVEVELAAKIYNYALAFELPDGFRELRVAEERLSVDGRPVFTREIAEVRLAKTGKETEARFSIDWHLVALPIVQHRSESDPIFIFRRWLATMLILRPIPSVVDGYSESETLEPDPGVANLGAWFSGVLLSGGLSASTKILQYLREVMPDLENIQNDEVGRDHRSLVAQFSNGPRRMTLPFEALSDGEKCFMIYALVIAANHAYGPLQCFWDEPDNFLAPSEVAPSVLALRQAFLNKGQLIVTSHSPETIRSFSDEATLVLSRHSHLEPTIARSVEDLRANGELTGDLVDAVARGDVAA